MATEKVTPTQMLFPIALLSFVMVVFLGFQTTLLISDRNSMKQVQEQQDKPLQQIEKLKSQVNALAIGTLKLSEQGNKDAADIIAQLKKAGVDVVDQAPAAAQTPGSGVTPTSGK